MVDFTPTIDVNEFGYDNEFYDPFASPIAQKYEFDHQYDIQF